MDEDAIQAEGPAPRRRLTPLTVMAASLVAGLALGFGGVASAQTADPTPSPSSSAPSDTAQDEEGDKDAAADTAGATAA